MRPDGRHSDSYLQGAIFFHRGAFEAARRCFEEALSGARLAEDSGEIVAALINLGNVHAALRNRNEARASYREALAIQRRAPDIEGVGLTLVNLGNLHREGGETPRAKAYYLEAIDLLVAEKEGRSLGVAYSNLALAEQDEGHLKEAVVLFKKAIDLHKKMGHEEGLAATWGQLGRTYLRLEKSAESETCLNYAASHYNNLADPEGEAEALRSLADLYERRGEMELAFHCLTRVGRVYQQFGLPKRDEDSARINRLIQTIRKGGR